MKIVWYQLQAGLQICGHKLTTDELWSVASMRIFAWSILQVRVQVCAVRGHPPNSATHSTPVCWDMLPCSLVECDWCFRKTYCRHLQGRTLWSNLLQSLFPWYSSQNHVKPRIVSSPLHFLPKNYTLISLFFSSLPLALSQPNIFLSMLSSSCVAHTSAVKVEAMGFYKMLVTICLPGCVLSHLRTSTRTLDHTHFHLFTQNSEKEPLSWASGW
jgi:hypothetical protein